MAIENTRTDFIAALGRTFPENMFHCRGADPDLWRIAEELGISDVHTLPTVKLVGKIARAFEERPVNEDSHYHLQRDCG
jgi:hypothetical protein